MNLLYLKSTNNNQEYCIDLDDPNKNTYGYLYTTINSNNEYLIGGTISNSDFNTNNNPLYIINDNPSDNIKEYSLQIFKEIENQRLDYYNYKNVPRGTI